MSDRWYNQPGNNDDVILVSRIRLLRNFAAHPFPNREDEDETEMILGLADKKLQDLAIRVGSTITEVPMETLGQEEKNALEERHLINRASLLKEKDLKVYASEDESFSMTINVEDHLRLLLSEKGQCLKKLWEKMDGIDDYIDSRIPYAFDKKVGFKTASISNMGTGLRCYYIMHLPLLCEEKSFRELLSEMSKYGVIIKEAWSVGARKIPGLYVLYNQRTLGLSEEDIIDILTNVANRLLVQERSIRTRTPDVILRDRVYRSYGILKYAERLELVETCRMLSNIMLGVSMGYLTTISDFSVYELMLGVFPGNLQVFYKERFNDVDMKEKRAEYLHMFLSQISIADQRGI